MGHVGEQEETRQRRLDRLLADSRARKRDLGSDLLVILAMSG